MMHFKEMRRSFPSQYYLRSITKNKTKQNFQKSGPISFTRKLAAFKKIKMTSQGNKFHPVGVMFFLIQKKYELQVLMRGILVKDQSRQPKHVFLFQRNYSVIVDYIYNQKQKGKN